MLDAPFVRRVKSNIKRRASGIAFSLPRGERMRCGVFSLVEKFSAVLLNRVLQGLKVVKD
jgi:hypothetical protein